MNFKNKIRDKHFVRIFFFFSLYAFRDMTQNENVIIIAPPSEQHLRSRWDFWPISVVSDDQTVLGQKRNKKKPLMYLDP